MLMLVGYYRIHISKVSNFLIIFKKWLLYTFEIHHGMIVYIFVERKEALPRKQSETPQLL